jgi:hypothetical protein
MRSNSLAWSEERLSSDALQPRFSPLQCLIPIPGPILISEGCEKAGDGMRIKRKQEKNKYSLNFIIDAILNYFSDLE